MNIAVVLLLLVPLTTALKCYQKIGAAVPAAGTDQTFEDGEFSACETAVVKCYNTTYSQGGDNKVDYGCGDTDLCASVNAAPERKKRDTTPCAFTEVITGVTLAELTAGKNTLACDAGYTMETGTDDNVLRYCYNEVGWMAYQYQGVADPSSAFTCAKTDAEFFTVTVAARTDDRLVPVVTLGGDEVVAAGGDIEVHTGTSISFACQYPTYQGEDTSNSALATWAVTEAATVTADLTIATAVNPCKVETGFAWLEYGVSGITATTILDPRDLPGYVSTTADTDVKISCTKGNGYEMDTADEELAEDADKLLTYNGDAANEINSGSDDQWYATAAATSGDEITDLAAYCTCDLNTSLAIDVAQPDETNYQALYLDTIGETPFDSTATTVSLYLRCVEGYHQPENSVSAEWTDDQAWVELTFTAADISTLEVGDTTWAADGVVSACIADVVSTDECELSLLRDAGLTAYAADLTEFETGTDDTVAHDTVVVAKCAAVGYMQGYVGEVELHSYKCADGSFGDVYVTCTEYTGCESIFCETDGCNDNSSTGIFSALSLVIGILALII